MGLSVGIVGLPNVGKSTLFNALLKKEQAYVANFPFATIEPNIGVVPVPDRRLEFLAETIASESSKSQTLNPKQISNPNFEFQNKTKWPPIVPATVKFIDIAGLIAGAHEGEGLGNKFLAHIRETNALCHVLRGFTDENIVKEGSVDPKKDFETVETELKLADFQTLEKQKDPGLTLDKEARGRWETVVKIKAGVSQNKAVRELGLDENEAKVAKELGLLTTKQVLVAVNCDEEDLKKAKEIEERVSGQLGIEKDQVVVISAKVEQQIAGLSDEEQQQYLKDLGVEVSGLERLIKKAFKTLGLITFLTAGEKEVRAWNIRLGATAFIASGEIHTDFMNNFIKADVVTFEDFVVVGGWKNAREKGKVVSEGKDYIVKDGDVIEFKVGV